MNPPLRQAWRLLEDLPSKISLVHRWCIPQRQRVGEGTMHSVPTMVVCLRGVVRIRQIGGQNLDLYPGDILLIAPGVWHEHAPILHDSLWFGQGFMAAWSDVVIGGEGIDWIGKIPIDPSLNLLRRALLVPDETVARNLIREVISLILTESIEAVDLKRPELKAMIDRLWTCCHFGVKTEDLIQASGLSRAQAYVIFKRGYGVTPKQAIESMRLWLAGSYLESGLSLSEAALQSGYQSVDSFRRAWKRTHRNNIFAHQNRDILQ